MITTRKSQDQTMYRHPTTLRKRHSRTEDSSLETPTQKKFKETLNAIRDKLDFQWRQSESQYKATINAQRLVKKSTSPTITTRTHRRHRFDSTLTRAQCTSNPSHTEQDLTRIPITINQIKKLCQTLPHGKQQNQESLERFLLEITQQLKLTDLDLFIHFSIILKRYHQAKSRQAMPFLFTTYDCVFLCAVLTLQFHGDDSIFVESTSEYATLFRIPKTNMTNLYDQICRQTIELLKLIDYKLLISNKEKETELLLHLDDIINNKNQPVIGDRIYQEMETLFDNLNLQQ